MNDELDKYRRFLLKEDPLIIAILKGHLVIESLLNDIIGNLVTRGDLLQEAANSFHRKRLIAQSHAGERSEDTAWEMVRIINKLRNEIAHQLESSKLENLLKEISSILKDRDLTAYNIIPDSNNSVQLLSHSVSFLIGFLQGYRREIVA